MKKLSNEEFLERAKEINPELSFEKAKYINSRSLVIVTCPIHGDFECKANIVLNKIECPKCNLEKRKNEFIYKAKLIHGDKYDYSNINYITNKIPVKIICPEHGEFMQAPGDHLKGYGCSKCSGKYKPTTEEWINKVKPIYNYKYDYSKTNYIDNKTSVIVICPEHGEFLTNPSNHLKGKSGCPKCNDIRKHNQFSKSTEEFIKESKLIHGNLYDYSKVSYYNKSIPVTIICKKHGEFKQIPSVHLIGCGCPKCVNKNQYKLFEFLCNKFPNEEILYEVNKTTVPWIQSLRFDIYFPKYNIAVEYDGQQHFKPIEKFGGELKFEETKRLDALKDKLCEENNCYLFRIPYNSTREYLINTLKAIENIIKYHKFGKSKT